MNRVGRTLLSAAAVLAAATVAAAAPERRPYLILNEDCNHFLSDFLRSAKGRAGAMIGKADIEAYADKWLNPAVTHYFVNTQGQAAWYDSKVLERVQDIHRRRGCKCSAEPYFRQLDHLSAIGIDPFAVMMARAREKGISPWVSMRMNDVHSIVRTNTCSSSDFWRRHPEFRREPNLVPRPGVGVGHFCFDYAHEEVRALHLACAEELLSRYDADGIEFDWIRWPNHLAPGRERADSGCLTDFMRRARRLADAAGARRGRPFKVAVRVTTDPDEALAFGTDVAAWARERLIDAVIPCNFLDCADFALPLGRWRRILAEADGGRTLVIPGFDQKIVMEYRRYYDWRATRRLSDAEHAGLCELLLAEGAGGFYLFNHFDVDRASPAGRLFSEPGVLTPAALAASERSYPITFRDCVLSPSRAGCQLPLAPDRPVRLRLAVGKAPASGSCRVKLAFAAEPPASLIGGIRLNGVKPESVAALPVGPWLGPRPESKAVRELVFPAAALKDGDGNLLEFAGEAGAPEIRACALDIPAAS